MAAAGSQTHTRPLAAAQAQRTPWPQVAVQVILTNIDLVAARPSLQVATQILDISTVFDGNRSFGQQCIPWLWQGHGHEHAPAGSIQYLRCQSLSLRFVRAWQPLSPWTPAWFRVAWPWLVAQVDPQRSAWPHGPGYGPLHSPRW